MEPLLYKIGYSFLWLISKLPWPIFYLISDMVYFVVYYVVGYRKQIVTDNLKQSFPEKSEKEILKIRRKFYSHMCDMFLEMIKSITISEKEIKKRFKFKNLEGLHKLETDNKSFILLAAHYASYEWGNVLELISKYLNVGVYKPVRNPKFDLLAKSIRGRFGSEIVPSKKIIRHAILKEREQKQPRIYGLVADQSPSRIKADTPTVSFLGREVPVFVGGEILAKKLNLNIAYLKVEKVKRGFYEAEIVIISEDVNSLKNYEVTNKYYKLLEAQIYKQPEFYLWTHKRWKHAR